MREIESKFIQINEITSNKFISNTFKSSLLRRFSYNQNYQPIHSASITSLLENYAESII